MPTSPFRSAGVKVFVPITWLGKDLKEALKEILNKSNGGKYPSLCLCNSNVGREVNAQDYNYL